MPIKVNPKNVIYRIKNQISYATNMHILKPLFVAILCFVATSCSNFYGLDRKFSDSAVEALGHFPGILTNTTLQEKQDAVVTSQPVAQGEILLYHGNLYDSRGPNDLIIRPCLSLTYVELTPNGWLAADGAWICEYDDVARVGSWSIFYHDMLKREQRTTVTFGRGQISDTIEVIWEDESTTIKTLTESEYFIFVNESEVFPKRILFWKGDELEKEITLN